MDYGQLNLIWAGAMIDALVCSGVKHAVISPGSRSTPLTLACVRHGDLRTWLHQDERSAAFFALGIGKQLNSPVAVIATSGTAPANWHPAVIEASYDKRPLILLSADRPAELQDCGANQTIDQSKLFGVHARIFYSMPTADISMLQVATDIIARAVDRSRWPVPGPVHINVAFREPLVPLQNTAQAIPAADTSVPRVRYPRPVCQPQDLESLSQQLSKGLGLMVFGRGNFSAELPQVIALLANRLRCPVLVDPLSGLRFGNHDHSQIVSRYDAFLRQKDFCTKYRPDWVLRFGGVPTSKILQVYLGQASKPKTILVNPQGTWPDPEHNCSEVFHADPLQLCRDLLETDLKPGNERWSATFTTQEKRAQRLLENMSEKPLEAEVLDSLIQRCPPKATLFCGNSMIVRDVDSFSGDGEKQLQLIGNRGASGIDGNISTALGMAAVSNEPVIALLGDLALYHDMNGLLSGRELDAVLVVFNNGGGAIFSLLPQAQLPEFKDYWLTPTGLDIARIARLYGMKHHRVDDKTGFTTAFETSLEHPGVDLIEVMIDREQSIARRRTYWRSVVSSQ